MLPGHFIDEQGKLQQSFLEKFDNNLKEIINRNFFLLILFLGFFWIFKGRIDWCRGGESNPHELSPRGF